MNFMLTLFSLTIATTLASHVEYVEPPPLHRTVHVIRKVHAPIVQSVHHHVAEVPVPVPVHVPVPVPVAVEAPLPVLEEVDPFVALVDKVKAHLFGKHLLRKRSLDLLNQQVAFKKDVVASKAALLHRKFDYLSHLKH